MSRKGCDCIERVDETLKLYNTRLVVAFALLKGPVSRATIATERIEKLRDGKKAKVVAATFCPFCGKKYPE